VRVTGKNKFHPITCHEGTEREKMCSSTLSLTSALDWGGWSTPLPVCFSLGYNPVPNEKGAVWLQGRSRWVRKISRIRSQDRRSGLRYPGPFWELHGGAKHIVTAKCRVTGA